MFRAPKTIINKIVYKGESSRKRSKHSHTCNTHSLTFLPTATETLKFAVWVSTKPHGTATTTPYEKLV